MQPNRSERERERIQLAMCILMCLKSSSVMPFSLSSGCTTSTSSWSNNCLLSKNHRNKTDPISKNMKNKNPKNKNIEKQSEIQIKMLSWKERYQCDDVQKLAAMFGSDTRNILRLIETLMSMFPDGSRFRFDG